jgi:symplekin
MPLCLALCTRDTGFLKTLLASFASAPTAARDVICSRVQTVKLVPLLASRLGPRAVLEMVQDHPRGAAPLVLLIADLLVMRAVREAQQQDPPGAVPRDLVEAARALYEKSNPRDARFLIPLLPMLPKAEALAALPDLLRLPARDPNGSRFSSSWQGALARVIRLKARMEGGAPPMTPADLMVALHTVGEGKTHNKEGSGGPVSTERIKDATKLCFGQSGVFTQKLLSVVLSRLAGVQPVPLLLMRTVIQSVKTYPGLRAFVIDILAQLSARKVWTHKQPAVWEGWVYCANMLAPDSFSAVLNLPPDQVKSALKLKPDLKRKLAEHVERDRSVRHRLSRATLKLLGLR